MDSWGASSPANPLAGGWDAFFTKQASDINRQPPAWTAEASRYTYDQRLNDSSFAYDPVNGLTSIYQPASGFTQSLIDSNIDDWLRRTHPELFQFNTGEYGQAVNVGRVGEIPGFGKFDSAADADIQNVAQQYGIPVNFLKSIVARESSGDWAANSNAVASVRGGAPIYGYVGVFKDAALSWGVTEDQWNAANGNRLAQLQILATGLRKFYDQMPKDQGYTWLNVASMHFSGNYALTGYTDELGNNANGYVNDIQSWWKQLDQAAGNSFDPTFQPGQASAFQAGTLGSPNDANWSRINAWDAQILAAAQQTGVPANLIKAIMRTESGGDPRAVSPAGALGLMQLMPDGGWLGQPIDTNRALNDPAYNILMGAMELKAAYAAQGNDWDMAIRAYHGFGSDGNTTDMGYLQLIKGYENELSTGLAYNGTAAPAQTAQVAAIFGGGAVPPVSQGIEANDWTAANPDMYSYGTAYGLYNGEHPGVDFVVDLGSKLYVPVSGTVEMAGGTGYYQDDRYGASPYTGELLIRLDNGDQLILGHMEQIALKVGDRVAPGMYAGLSGTAGSGPHVHVEYRHYDPSKGTTSGYIEVDPRNALNGSFAGVYQQGVTGAGIDRPMTFADMMLAGAKGQPIRAGATSSGSGWHDWLLAAMQGRVPTILPGSLGYKRSGTTTQNAFGQYGQSQQNPFSSNPTSGIGALS